MEHGERQGPGREVQSIIVSDILSLALPLFTGASLLGTVLGLLNFAASPFRFVPGAIASVLCLVAWRLVVRGRQTLAAQLLLVTLLVVALVAMIFNGALRAPAAALLLVGVSLAGWVYGKRGTTFAAWAATLSVSAIACLATLGLLREVQPPAPLVHAGFFVVYVWLVWITTAYPQQRLRTAVKEALLREKALAEEQAQRRDADLAFEAVFQHTAYPMLLVDPRGVVLALNQAAERFLAASASEMIGRHLSEAPRWQAGDRRLLGTALSSVAKAGSPPARLQLLTVDSAPLLEVTLTRFEDVGGVLRYIIVEGRDVSALLENQERLNQARRHQLIGQLAGRIAHDFNNALAVVTSSSELLRAELLRQGPLSTDASECLDAISTVGLRAGDLTRRLLTFAHRNPLEPRVIAMHDLIETWVGFVQRLLPPSIRTTTHLTAERDTVDADVAAVESALLNLAINARDAMPTGGVLTIATEVREARPGVSELRVSVGDTGEGIAPELLERIFEPFYTTKAEGTGVGLASVESTMAAHGGRVQVESRLGSGTTFYLDFPLCERVPEVETARSPRATFAGRSALIVDDEPVLRLLLSRLLKELGFTTVAAPDAESALLVFNQSPELFDVALLDVVLPGKPGNELAGELLAASPTLKVLLVSGFTRDADIAVLPSDRIRLLSKPFSMDGLSRALAQILGPERVKKVSGGI